MNYYNEFDPKAAAWLRELIVAGLIPAGDVDERSITDVKAADLRGYTQCHFFAGIGGWAYALRLAGWSDDRPVWTGSCPCQPFSCAGKGRGTDDERHLWPHFARLIGECKPPVVFGEQVASKAGRDWLTGVFADLERLGYQRAGADLCAAGVGAPHIRQRLFWVADAANGNGRGGECGAQTGIGAVGERWRRPTGGRADGWMGNVQQQGLERHAGDGPYGHEPGRIGKEPTGSAPANGGSFSSSAIWHPCRDGKARRIAPEPALFPMADGLPGRVGLLRGAGNAIVPQVAQAFIEAFLDWEDRHE